jgi:hypothetical protein
MTASSSKGDWLVPAALIALAAIPVTAGTYRLVTLAMRPRCPRQTWATWRSWVGAGEA